MEITEKAKELAKACNKLSCCPLGLALYGIPGSSRSTRSRYPGPANAAIHLKLQDTVAQEIAELFDGMGSHHVSEPERACQAAIDAGLLERMEEGIERRTEQIWEFQTNH